jgi:hypothetical protein
MTETGIVRWESPILRNSSKEISRRYRRIWSDPRIRRSR